MADYYPLVSRAVAALEPNTFEHRRAVYNRARTAQALQLGKLDPPADNSVIARERQALEKAISIIETVAIATEHAENDSEIVSAYSTFCADTRTRPNCGYDVSVLPYPKHAIVAALERQIVLEPADIRAEWLQQGQMFLWRFLEGIGSHPVPLTWELQKATLEEIREAAKRIAGGHDPTERFWTLALQEADQINRRINAALQIRQERLALDKDFDRERLRLNDAISRAGLDQPVYDLQRRISALAHVTREPAVSRSTSGGMIASGANLEGWKQSMGGALVSAIFDRGLIVFAYWTITLITIVPTMLRSFVVGAAALAACVLCFASVSTVVGSVLAKRQKDYRATDLIGIGTIGLVLLVAGLALMIWSGFYLRIFDVEISGLLWALVAAAVGAVVVRRQDAL